MKYTADGNISTAKEITAQAILSNADLKLSAVQHTLLSVLAGTAQKLTLEQKAAMDETSYSGITKSGNNYVLDNGNVTYTKVNVVGETNTASRAMKSITPVGNFSYNFEINVTTMAIPSIAAPLIICDSNGNIDSGISNGVGCVLGDGSPSLTISKWVAGARTSGTGIGLTAGTLYYCTLARSETTLTLSVYTNSARTNHEISSPQTLTVVSDAFGFISVANNYAGLGGTRTYFVQNLEGQVFTTYSVYGNLVIGFTTGSINSNTITKDANIGLRYWSDIGANLITGASGSTVKMKILNSAGSALHTNYVTIASGEYLRIPLERPVTITATSGSQTVWNFTSLSNADALINELGVLAKAILVELALDGTNYTVLREVADYTEDISNILAPKITLVSSSGIVSGTSKLRATYIVNIPLSNTTIKLQIQLNRVAVGDTSPSIQPHIGDATKYVSAGQVAIV